MLKIQAVPAGQGVTHVRFSPCGTLLFASGMRGDIVRVGVADGNVEVYIPAEGVWFSRAIVQVTPSSLYIYAADSIWCRDLVGDAQERPAFPRWLSRGSWSGSTGTSFMALRTSHGIYVLDPNTESSLARLRYERPILMVPFLSHSGRMLATYRGELASGPAGPRTRGPFIQAVEDISREKLLPGPTQGIRSPTFSWDDQLFAATEFGRLHVWNLADGQVRFTRDRDPGPRWLALFGPGRMLLATFDRSSSSLVETIDAESGQTLKTMDLGIGAISTLAIAPNGLTAAAGSRTGQVAVWDLDQ
ncbi:MAG: WD40 repeat domain-containing protein [Gemmataceae bacterium]|nr:WD40 repeat domain-containing protein [Gemmataceae bacterium]